MQRPQPQTIDAGVQPSRVDSRRTAVWVLAAALFVGACGGGNSVPSGATAPTSIAAPDSASTIAVPEPSTVESTTPAAPKATPPSAPETTLPAETTVPTTVPSTVPTTVPAEPEPVALAPASVSVAVGGPDGVSYTEELENEAQFGPDNIAVDDAGGVHISDPLAHRIVVVRAGERSSYDLQQVGVIYAMDLIVAADRYVILDADGDVYRIVVASFDGSVVRDIAVPPEYSPATGLIGLIDTGDDSRFVLEMLGGADPFVEWNDATQTWQPTNTLEVAGRLIQAADGSLIVNGHPLPIGATPDNEWWASLRLAGVTATGEVVALRWDGTASVEWWSGDGAFVGAGALPGGAEQTIGEAIEEIAITADGRLFALSTGPDSITVSEVLRGPDRFITP